MGGTIETTKWLVGAFFAFSGARCSSPSSNRKMMKACWVGLQTDPTLGHIDEKRIATGDSDIN